MSRKRWIGLVKLALVAALMVYVFTTIQWRDRYTEVTAQDEVVTTFDGRILGDWDAKVVRFERLDAAPGAAPIEIEPGQRPDGSRVDVSAGILTYVRNLDWLLFALGALCYVVTLTIAATRWWWLLRANALAVTWLEAQRFTWIGVFFNNVVPGQTGGDLVKAIYIMKHCPGSRVQAMLSVIVDRILGLGSLALLGAIVVLFYLDRFAFLALGIWGVLAAVGLCGIVAFSRRIRRFVRLDALLRRLPPALSRPLMKVDEAVFFYRRHKAGIGAWILLGVASHVITVSSFVLMGQALGVGMPVAEYYVMIPVILIVSAVPIAPNGWGVGEALFRKLFGDYGAIHIAGSVLSPERVMGTRGVALSVVYRIHTTVWSLLGGLALFFEKERVTTADIDAELEREVELERIGAG